MGSSSFRKHLVLVFGLLSLTLGLSLTALPDGNLHVIACDVGQGDAILITYKTNQILIDGGPNNSVLSCLSRHMPFWDRTLEMVILTHPQADHFTGLIEVFRRYDVQTFLENDVPASAQSYQLLKSQVGGGGISTIRPAVSQRYRLGLIHLDVLNPPQDFISKNLNDYSIVINLTYGEFKAIFTGDVEGNMDSHLLDSGLLGPVNYLKVNHHGSKNGLTKSILDALKPEIAVISAGKNNRFGHPHTETLDLLNSYGVKILRTDQMGAVEILSDGDRWWYR